jgi:hypothetical protein
VVLDYKVKHTYNELGERLTCRRGAPGGSRRGEAGRPRTTGLGSSLPLSASIFSSALHAPLLLCDCVIHGVALPKHSRLLLCLHYFSFCRMDLPGPTTSVGTRTDYSVGPWDYPACATRHLMAWSTRTTEEKYSVRKLYMSHAVWKTPRRTRLVLSPYSDL